MPDSKNNKYYKQGFTLIELLIVIFILGIILLVFTYSINPNKQLNQEQDNIINLNNKIQWVLDYSAFSNRIFALTIAEDGYFFSEYFPTNENNISSQATTTWKPTNNANLSQTLWQNIKINHINLIIEDTSIAIDNLKEARKINMPHIIILPYYELSPFQLTLFNEEGNELILNNNQVLSFLNEGL